MSRTSMLNPDTLCPECHGEPELLLVRRDRLVRRCTECGHRWSEEPEPVVVPQFEPVGGWVRSHGFRTGRPVVDGEAEFGNDDRYHSLPTRHHTNEEAGDES